METFNFGKALEFLQKGFPIARTAWGRNKFVIKQINSDIEKDIIPRMTSLSDQAKSIMLENAVATIKYREQCILVEQMPNGNFATNYIPNWIDLFANDWYIVEP